MAYGDVYTSEQVRAEVDKYLPVINKGRENPIAPETAMAIFMAENMDKNDNVVFRSAKSPKNAMGVSQVIPDTLAALKQKGYVPQEIGAELGNSPLGHQVYAGLAAMREFADRRKTNDPAKLAALYNSGDRGAGRFLETGNSMHLPAETQLYLPKIEKALNMLGVPVTPSPATVKPGPEFATSPLGAAHDAYNQVQSLVPGLMKTMFDANERINAASQGQAAALRVGAEAAANSARLQAESMIAEQDVHKQIISALGLDVTDPDSAIRKELTLAANTRAEREKLGAEVAKRQGTSLFSDPVGWFQNLIELPNMVSQHNNLVSVENTAEAQVTRLQAVATSAKNLTPAKSADLLRAKAAADGQQMLATAQAQAEQLSAQNAAGNAKMVWDMMTVGRNRFNDILQLETRDANIEDRRARQDILKDAAEEKARAKQSETAFVQGINTFRRMIAGNVPPIDADFVKKMPAELKAEWGRVITRGGFGNYEQAIAFINEYGNPAGAAETGNATMMQFVRKVQAQATALAPAIQSKSNLANPMAKMDMKTAQRIAYQQLFEEQALVANKGYDKSSLSGTSPYAIDFDALAASAKGSEATNVIAGVLVRQKEAVGYRSLNEVMTPRAFVEAVQAEVMAGKADPKTVSQQLSAFFQVNSKKAYESAGLNVFGLAPLQDFVITPGARGNKQIDLFNATQVENYLTAEVAGRKAREAASQGNAVIGSSKDYFRQGTGAFNWKEQ